MGAREGSPEVLGTRDGVEMGKKFIKARLIDVVEHDVFICTDSIVRVMLVKGGLNVKLENSEEVYFVRDCFHTYTLDDIHDIVSRR